MKQHGDLIPLTPEELKLRGPMLARGLLELEDLKADHAEEKKAMRAAEEEIALRCRKLAKSIRDGRQKDEG